MKLKCMDKEFELGGRYLGAELRDSDDALTDAMAVSLQHDSPAQFAWLLAASPRNTDANRGVRQSSHRCVNQRLTRTN